MPSCLRSVASSGSDERAPTLWIQYDLLAIEDAIHTDWTSSSETRPPSGWAPWLRSRCAGKPNRVVRVDGR